MISAMFFSFSRRNARDIRGKIGEGYESKRDRERESLENAKKLKNASRELGKANRFSSLSHNIEKGILISFDIV